MKRYEQFKYQQDLKTVLMSVNDFFRAVDFTTPIAIWDETQRPQSNVIYYKFTSDSLIRVKFAEYVSNYGMGISQKLDYIQYAHRDGITEFYFLDQIISEMEKRRNQYISHTKISQINFVLEQFTRLKELMPVYQKKIVPPAKKFKDYLIDTGYKTEENSLKNKYIVFDVETNGIRTKFDDLLSISIYDPTTGLCYNRFFPLHLQPIILNTFIHGISDQTLEDSTHITQEELDQIIDYFQLRNKIILSFSGGKGTFDQNFFRNYCKRHQAEGFDVLQFENIKNKLPSPGWGFSGQMTKDNLCRLFQIDGIKSLHSGINDCVLEWKLYEKIASANYFFHNGNLYKYHPEYILPITYLNQNPGLEKSINISVPFIDGCFETVFSYSLPDEVLPNLKKFPTNITGIALENAIKFILNVKGEDNISFLAQNKSKIEYIGSLESQFIDIPMTQQSDGLLKAQNSRDIEYVEQINQVTKCIMENISPVIEFIVNHIFVDEQIKGQELVISPDRKILALCDFSSPTSIMEMKTFDIKNEDKTNLYRQLYYQSNGREIYIMTFNFEKHYDNYHDVQTEQQIIDGLNISIYHVTLKATMPDKVVYTKILNSEEVTVLKCIIDCPTLSCLAASKCTNFSYKLTRRIFKMLNKFGYITKDFDFKRSYWRVLRSPDDIYTEYTDDGTQYHIINTRNTQ